MRKLTRSIQEHYMSNLTSNQILKLPEIFKLRTLLSKNKINLRNHIVSNYPNLLAPIGQRGQVVVPSPRTFGIDGTLSELNDASGEYKYRVIASASTTGVVNGYKEPYDNSISTTIWSENKEKDLLQMSLYELKMINKTCEVANNDDLIVIDGPFWTILKDIKNMVEYYPELYDMFTHHEFDQLVNNLKNNLFCFVVKDFQSLDLKHILNGINRDYNNLHPKRVFDVVLEENESFKEEKHQSEMFNRYAHLRPTDKLGSDYLRSFYELLNYSRNIYKGEVFKFSTNHSSIKIEYLNSVQFKASKQSIEKALSIEMLGIQKEPYATFFAEDLAKNEAKKRISLNNLDEKIGMDQEDFLHNLPFTIRT